MLTIKNVQTPQGAFTNLTFDSPATESIDAEKKLIAFPAFIDTDVAFSTLKDPSGAEWQKQARAIMQSGISTVFDSDGIAPTTAQKFKQQVDDTLEKNKIPLRVHFFCDGSSTSDFNSIGKTKQYFKGLKTSIDLAKVHMPAPFGSALDRLFQIAAQENVIVIITLLQGEGDPQEQRKNALTTVKKTVALAEKYSAQLLLQHVRTKEEIKHIQEAKNRGVLIFTEVAYPHLFLTDKDVQQEVLKSSQMFLPTPSDQEALWAGINDGSIDMVGSGSHFFSAEDPLFAAKLFCPAMLNAYHENKLRIDTLIGITRVNAENIFRLPPNNDAVLVDMSTAKAPEFPSSLKSSFLSSWSNKNLTGWPVHSIVKGHLIK